MYIKLIYVNNVQYRRKSDEAAWCGFDVLFSVYIIKSYAIPTYREIRLNISRNNRIRYSQYSRLADNEHNNLRLNYNYIDFNSEPCRFAHIYIEFSN